jgi:hypothetical protein
LTLPVIRCSTITPLTHTMPEAGVVHHIIRAVAASALRKRKMKAFIGGFLFIALIALYYRSGGQAKSSRALDFAVAAVIATIITLGSAF